MLLYAIVAYAGTQKKVSAVKQTDIVPQQIRTPGQSVIISNTVRSGENSGNPGPRFAQSATGGDVVVTAGTQVMLNRGTSISLGGNFLNYGTFVARTPSLVDLNGTGPQTLNGATSFDNLAKSGGGTLTLASPITVNDSLYVVTGNIDTGSDSISFGPKGTLNGTSAGGQVIGPGKTIGPAYASFSASVADGWNLVSVPLMVSDFRKEVLYPTAISRAFLYQGSYKTHDTLSIGSGFWIKFGGAQSDHFTGNALSNDTLDVNTGWNLIGSLSFRLPTSRITTIGTTIISNIFGYHGSYAVADTIMPGAGYWVKTSGAGKLVYSTSASIQPSSTVMAVKQSLEQMSRLTIEDANGQRQVLYFGKKSNISLPLGYYMAPPVAPEGSFDARYGTQRMAEIADENVSKVAPVILSATNYPVTISWQIVSSGVGASLSVNGKETDMGRDGSVKITTKNPKIMLSLNSQPAIPRTFALQQNFPNPFNPTTTIRYDLPKAARISLKVYDILGREVITLIDGLQDAGFKSVGWDASAVPSGVYIYGFVAREVEGKTTFTDARKMILLK